MPLFAALCRLLLQRKGRKRATTYRTGLAADHATRARTCDLIVFPVVCLARPSDLDRCAMGRASVIINDLDIVRIPATPSEQMRHWSLIRMLY